MRQRKLGVVLTVVSCKRATQWPAHAPPAATGARMFTEPPPPATVNGDAVGWPPSESGASHVGLPVPKLYEFIEPDVLAIRTRFRPPTVSWMASTTNEPDARVVEA